MTLAHQQGIRVIAIKMPVPPDFSSQIPDEPEFDAAVSDLLAKQQVEFLDFSSSLAEPRFYFDTDHLNRTGVTEFFEKHLKAILLSPTSAP